MRLLATTLLLAAASPARAGDDPVGALNGLVLEDFTLGAPWSRLESLIHTRIYVCYMDATYRQGELPPRVVVSGTVLPDGTLAAVSVQPDGWDEPAFQACAAAGLATVRLSDPGGGPANLLVTLDLIPGKVSVAAPTTTPMDVDTACLHVSLLDPDRQSSVTQGPTSAPLRTEQQLGRHRLQIETTVSAAAALPRACVRVLRLHGDKSDALVRDCKDLLEPGTATTIQVSILAPPGWRGPGALPEATARWSAQVWWTASDTGSCE